jgi:hypothetical protein
LREKITWENPAAGGAGGEHDGYIKEITAKNEGVINQTAVCL